MKIIVKSKDVEICIDESDNLETKDKSRKVTMKFEDENKRIQETLVVMCDQVKKLLKES